MNRIIICDNNISQCQTYNTGKKYLTYLLNLPKSDSSNCDRPANKVSTQNGLSQWQLFMSALPPWQQDMKCLRL